MIKCSSSASLLIGLLRLDFHSHLALSLPVFGLSSLDPTLYLSLSCCFCLRLLLCVTWQPAFPGVCSSGMHSEVCRSVWRRGLAHWTRSHAVNNPSLSRSVFSFSLCVFSTCSFLLMVFLFLTCFRDCCDTKIADPCFHAKLTSIIFD